jgi:glycosyltransferase involved in cell wall biosynthesis
MINKYKLAIYALHPIMYQVPIFKELKKVLDNGNLNVKSVVLFGDDLSLKNTFSKAFQTSFSYGNWLIEGYTHKLLKNYTKDSRGGFFSRINFGIFKELRKEKYDAILIHGYESLTAWLTMAGAKLTGTKIIWRGEAVLRGIEGGNSIKQVLKRFVLRKFFNSCDAIMFSCTGNKEYLKFYAVGDNKLFSIPCAVNNEFFQKERDKYIHEVNNIKNELGIDKDNLVILFSARFTSRKRPLDLLNALTKIDSSKITVLFVGDGPERKYMEEFAQENNINVIFTGFVNQTEISKYYSVSDLDIVISDYDPSPKAMNEAMNFRLPIIVSSVVGTAYDLVKDGESGFIVKVGDINAIAEKINYLNKNREKLIEMGNKSFDIVQNWSYKEDVDGIIEAFNFVQKNLN